MVHRRCFIVAIRPHGFRFHLKAKSLKNDIYRRSTGELIQVPCRDTVDDDHVRRDLLQLGVSPEEIDALLKRCAATEDAETCEKAGKATIAAASAAAE